jgi:hypothetical protein
MVRVKQFADDLGISKNQAKNLINKGRSRKDGGSQILESVMKPKKYKLGGSETNPKAPVSKVKIERLMTQKDKADIKEKADKQYRERNNRKNLSVKKSVKKSGKQSSGKKQSSEKIIKDLQDFENTKSDITASTDREFSKKVFEANKKAEKEAGETRKQANPISKRKAGGQENFGMLSVKAGIDKNPNATQADRIAGATKNLRGGGIAIQGLGFRGVR